MKRYDGFCSFAVCAWVVLAVIALFACQPTGLSDAQAADVTAESPEASTMELAHQANINAINGVVGRFVEVYQQEDVDGFLELYEDDAVRMPPDEEILEGRGAIRVNIENAFAAGDLEVTLRVEETEFSGDLAFCRGSWVLATTPKGGGETQRTVGKWMNLMRRQPDGSWKIARDIWNTDAPAGS